ncbi:hypothetical protein WN48_01466 [Eufriesea mexicana]|nr:hypothetical protein WN48_01466 [Eufriesea mexicana]
MHEEGCSFLLLTFWGDLRDFGDAVVAIGSHAWLETNNSAESLNDSHYCPTNYSRNIIQPPFGVAQRARASPLLTLNVRHTPIYGIHAETATISRQLRRDCREGGEESGWKPRGRRSAAKVTGKRRTGVAEETRETARLETKEVEGESVDDGGGGGSGVNGDSGTIGEGGRKKNKNGASSRNGNSGASGVSGGGLSCRGGTLQLLRGLVEGPIGRVAARVHRWGTAGGVNPSAPSGRECPGGEGTPRRNVLDATKNRRLMGANLTKQSRRDREENEFAFGRYANYAGACSAITGSFASPAGKLLRGGQRPRNEMWNANDDNEWRPKLGYARLRLKLREHAPGFIIFRENWPGKRAINPLPYDLRFNSVLPKRKQNCRAFQPSRGSANLS